MSKKIMLGTVLLAMTVSASADVLVTTPEEIIVVSVNDQEIRGGLFGGNKNTYRLEAGGHQIAVKYQQIFEENYINHDVVRSGIVKLDTGVLKDGETYQLILVNAPQDHDAAKKFAQQPTIGLKNSAGTIVAQQTGASTRSQPWLSSLLGNDDSEIDVRSTKIDASKQAIPAAVPVVEQGQTVAAASSIPVITPIVKTAPVASITAANAKDQQLIDLWKTASAQERQKFMAWLAEQVSK